MGRVLWLIRAMRDVILDVGQDGLGLNDQGIINYLVRWRKPAGIEAVHLVSSGYGLLRQVGVELFNDWRWHDPGSISLGIIDDARAVVLNHDGRMAPVVHQYDRDYMLSEYLTGPWRDDPGESKKQTSLRHLLVTVRPENVSGLWQIASHIDSWNEAQCELHGDNRKDWCTRLPPYLMIRNEARQLLNQIRNRVMVSGDSEVEMPLFGVRLVGCFHMPSMEDLHIGTSVHVHNLESIDTGHRPDFCAWACISDFDMSPISRQNASLFTLTNQGICYCDDVPRNALGLNGPLSVYDCDFDNQKQRAFVIDASPGLCYWLFDKGQEKYAGFSGGVDLFPEEYLNKIEECEDYWGIFLGLRLNSDAWIARLEARALSEGPDDSKVAMAAVRCSQKFKLTLGRLLIGICVPPPCKLALDVAMVPAWKVVIESLAGWDIPEAEDCTIASFAEYFTPKIPEEVKVFRTTSDAEPGKIKMELLAR